MISSTQLTYNNLIISNYTAGATTVFLNNATNPINYTLNGNFDLKNNASGSITFYFGNSTPSDNLINMSVNGNVTIGPGCNIRVNNFATSHALPNPNNSTSTFPIHSLSVFGDLQTMVLSDLPDCRLLLITHITPLVLLIWRNKLW